MASAADIITYVGVPLAILGVMPILYTFLKTMVLGVRLKRTLGAYDIEASVHSRLLSGIVEVDVPVYQLCPLPREQDDYWRVMASKGLKNGASWQSMNWTRRPIDSRTLQIHFSDRIQLPEASINFGDLIYMLGDLGAQTNQYGFWELAQKGLQALPGTPLVDEISEDGVVTPILIIAQPTVQHQGSLLLRLQNAPSRIRRSKADMSPNWLRLPEYPISRASDPTSSKVIPATDKTNQETETEEHESQGLGTNNSMPGAVYEGSVTQADEEKADSQSSRQVAQIIATQSDKSVRQESDIVEYVRITRKGIIEKKLKSGKAIPVLGLPFWFTYSILASTVRDGHLEFNGRPFGYHLRLKILYFSRECVLPITFRLRYLMVAGRDVWYELFAKLLSHDKMSAIPSEWTENSSSRKNDFLTRKFELLIEDHIRFRSAAFRRARKDAIWAAFQDMQESQEQEYINIEFKIPAESFEVTFDVWTQIAIQAAGFISPLTPDRVPTSQEVCLAAGTNPDFAAAISEMLVEMHRYFEDGKDLSFLDKSNSEQSQAVFMCAIIVLESIAENAPYLAALSDVEDCVTKWNPVYLC